MTFAEARARFPVLERLAYLNAGTFGPLSRASVEAITAEERRAGEEGRVGLPYFERVLALRSRVRERIAAEIRVAPEQLALTDSTTTGCNIVLAGLGLGPDDEVVTTETEHFGLLGALIASPARVRVARLERTTGDEAVDRLLAEVGPRTRLLAVSHVSWITGHRLDLDRLGRESGVAVLVDGAQAAGAIGVEAPAVDFYTVSGQKWLCGPDSTGALFVADPERLAVARPSYFSQTSVDFAAPAFEPKPGAPRFDSGWTPLPSLAGLDAAFDDLPEWRFARAAETAARCRDLLAERHEVITDPGHATLVSFRPRGEAAEAAKRLYERGVAIRDLPGTGLLRVSCGWWTSDEDLERLVAGLER